VTIELWLLDRVSLQHKTRVRYHWRALRGRLDRELPLARRLLRPGSIVADVGANTGLYAYAFGRFSAVEAFEPLPEPARMLQALATTLPRLRVHQVALSSRAGTGTLYVPRGHDGHPLDEFARLTPVEGAHDTAVVPIRTLDEYALQNLGLIKIDVEGHELSVLDGARETIARERPVLLVEIEQRHLSTSISDTFAAVAALGYRGTFLDHHGRRHPIDAFRYERDQAPYLPNPIDARYVNNFLFIHETDMHAQALL
jgi:FkbM family methyltransferase